MQDLASQLYQIAKYSHCPVYQVLHQVAEDLDTNKNKNNKHGANLTLCRTSLLAQVINTEKPHLGSCH